MKVYVGCALTHATESFKVQVSEMKERLKENGYDVLEFVGLSAGSAKDVYEHDIHGCVAKCDAFVAVCELPSIGLGYELCYAVEVRKIPTLAIASDTVKVTRLVEGITADCFTFTQYNQTETLYGAVYEWLKSVNL